MKFVKALFVPLLFVAIIIVNTGQSGGVVGVTTFNNIAAEEIPAMPDVILGGDGRYMYWLIANNYTSGSPTTQYVMVTDAGASDAIIDTITLTANKNFSAIYFRAVDTTIHVGSSTWVDVIDARPASGTWNTVINSGAYDWSSSAAPPIAMYLPYPLDFFTTGGTNVPVFDETDNVPYVNNIIGNNELDYGLRLGGHSNWPNSVYYHESQLIWSNNNFFKVINQEHVDWPNSTYHMEGYQGGAVFNDLNGQFAYPIRFGNFQVCVTTNSAYLLPLHSVGTQISQTPWPTLGTSSRVMQEYAPNARKLFFANQISNNNISVLSFDTVNHILVDDGDIDRTAYKATNENGAAMIIYNPYNGYIYVQANNNSNVTGVNKFHVYDPTQVTASMYIRSVTLGEFKSDSRASINALNSAVINRTRLFEFSDVNL